MLRRVLIITAILAVVCSWQFARGAGGALPREQMNPSIFYRVRTSRPLVALTLDDGPKPIYTAEVLHFLQDAGVHATFFVLGHRALENPDLLAATIAAGNEIGNHTMTHLNLTTVLDREQNAEITGGADALARLGVHPVLFRPPYGQISAVGVSDAVAIGERTVLWSVSLDREVRIWGDQAAAEILRRIRPGDIILAHDTHPKTFDALKKLLAGLRGRGFSVVTVSELLANGSV